MQNDYHTVLWFIILEINEDAMNKEDTGYLQELITFKKVNFCRLNNAVFNYI